MKEEDFEDMEDELDDLEEEEKSVPTNSKPRKVKTEESKDEKPKERYTPIYQREIIGIADTVTGELVVEGLRDLPTAQLEAIKLNQLDKLGIVSGVE